MNIHADFEELLQLLEENRVDYMMQGRPQPMKVREVLRILQEAGWSVVRVRGSHRQLRHPEKRGTVTVAGHLNVDVPSGTLKSIWKQAGIER